MQSLIVAVIVATCAVYATWTVMPAAWRRGLAQRLRGTPLGRLRAVQRAAGPAGAGCGCSGCDAAPPPGATAQPVRIVRRR